MSSIDDRSIFMSRNTSTTPNRSMVPIPALRGGEYEASPVLCEKKQHEGYHHNAKEEKS